MHRGPSDVSGPAIVGIAAQPGQLVFQLGGSAAAVRIVELRPYHAYAPAGIGAVAWEGWSPNSSVTVPRLVDGRDRLYSKFQLADTSTGRALGSVHWVTDLDALPAWSFAMPWPKSKKGISCPVDIEDLKALGARYADDGFVLATLFDWSPGPWKETWEVDGQTIGINLGCVHDLDRRVKRMSEIVATEGNFPWHVAFHPYPENLFEPRFWNDQTAALGFDTARITFKNLEVLPAFLAQERFLYQGRPRRIILSEQGFRCTDGPSGELVQAAAFATTPGGISVSSRNVPRSLRQRLATRPIGVWSAASACVKAPGFGPMTILFQPTLPGA